MAPERAGAIDWRWLFRLGLVAEQRFVQIERFVVEFFDADRAGGHFVEIFDDQIEFSCRRGAFRRRTRCARRLFDWFCFVRSCGDRFGCLFRHGVHQLFFRYRFFRNGLRSHVINDDLFFVLDRYRDEGRRRNVFGYRGNQFHDRRSRTQRAFTAGAVSQLSQAALYDAEDFVAWRRRVFAQPFKVIVDAADGIGERIERGPIRRIPGNEFIADVEATPAELFGGDRERHH